MSDEIFLRRYRLKVGRETGTLSYEMTPDVEGLRITFMATHFAGGAFSIAEITLYNMRESVARQMLGDGPDGKYKFISLEAGYSDLFGAVFVGQVTNVQRVLEDGGATRGIKFFCASLAKDRDLTSINLTLSPETDPVQIIEECASVYGAEIQFYGDFSGLKRRSRGTVLQGSPRACMNELAQAFEFAWMVENDVMKIIKRDFAMNMKATISGDTGMIGSPVVTDSEVGIRYILNPKLKLGDTIKLESMAPRFEFSGAFYSDAIPRTIGEGYYKINSLVFVGDSHGDQWETQISCLRLNAAAQADISNRATR
jgi:hypothetical protein